MCQFVSTSIIIWPLFRELTFPLPSSIVRIGKDGIHTMGSHAFHSPPIVKAQGLPYFTPANNAGGAVNPEDPNTPTLFRPLRIRDVTLKNRVIVAPMCTYSAESDPSSPAVGARQTSMLLTLAILPSRVSA